jgi:hypothetical protein
MDAGMSANLSLSTILKKCKKMSNSPLTWTGYLRPDEILVLLKAGAVETHDQHTSWAAIRKAKGDCSPSWFYFYPSKKIKEMNDPEFFMEYYRRKTQKRR